MAAGGFAIAQQGSSTGNTPGSAALGPLVEEELATLPPAKGQFAQIWASFRHDRRGYTAFWILVSFASACVLLPWVLPWRADEIDFSLLQAAGPQMNHPLGADVLGRDQLARLMSAGRISLTIGFMVALISSSLGALVGIVAGYFGGRVELLMMGFVDVLLTIPPLPLLMALAALVASPHSSIGSALRSLPEEWRIIVIMGMLGWMGIARIVRSQVISIRKQEYVEAAHAFGASHGRIMLLHILPNTVSTIAIFTTFAVSGAILVESGLSFLGLGVRPPTPTLGNMIGESSNLFAILNYWWLTWTPAVAILLIVLCVNFTGEGLRAAMERSSR